MVFVCSRSFYILVVVGLLSHMTCSVQPHSPIGQEDHEDVDSGESETELRRHRVGYGQVKSAQSLSGHGSNRATITFPEEEPNQRNNETGYERRKLKKSIPLKLLRNLNNERTVSKIFEKYVSNVKVQDSDGQKYFVDMDGRPIDAGLEELVGPPAVTQLTETPQKTINTFNRPSTFSHNRHKQVPLTLTDRVGIPTRVTKPAVCEPELRTVEIPPPNDPNVVQFPKCVRLDRCGGCCGSDLLICEPLRTVQTEVQVQKFAYNDETEKLEYRDTQILLLPSHTQCRCNCRIKAADCSARHVYNSEDCLCICKNRGEQELCAQTQHKLWDASLCQCVCREIKVCSSGYTFNIETCDCVLDRRRLGLADDDTNSRRDRREFGRVRFWTQN